MSLSSAQEIVEEQSVVRSKEQQRVFDYLTNKQQSCCLVKNMTDQEYVQYVAAQVEALKLKQKALSKIGLDESEVNEIPPVNFEDYLYDGAYVRQTESGVFVSNIFESTWVLFSATQVYVYRYRHYLDRDKKKEQTEEYFYKDIVGLSTTSKEEKTKSVISFKKKGCGGPQTNIANNESIEQTKFCIKVPGDSLYVSMQGTSENEEVVQAMKAKLREKKNG